MSVLIKGMEMPKNCFECNCEDNNWCVFLDKHVESIDKDKDCPLVEVPTPHGRLIDADNLLKHKTDHEMISTHLIWNAPTVIEADNK